MESPLASIETTDLLLTSPEAAALLRVRPQTLRAWRHRGDGPRFIRYGSTGRGPAFYRRDELDAWIDARVRRSTSEEATNDNTGHASA